MPPSVQIDAFIDLTCPYCFLGKRQLERALTATTDLTVSIHWQSLQLSPDTPGEGKLYHQRMAEIIGSEAGKDEALARIREAGKPLGIDFRFDRIERMPNTLLAHCLINWCEPGPEQDGMVEALLNACFTEGRFLGDRDTLAAITKQVTGQTDLAERLRDPEAVEQVRQQLQQNQQLGLGGVPAFVFNRQYLISGAQDASHFRQLLAQLQQGDGDN